MSHLKIEEQIRFPAIDIIRILAALWVAIVHLSGGHDWFSSLKYPYGDVLSEEKFGIFSGFIRLGFVGVPIFFVISGYVIVLSSQNKSGTMFMADRIARLFPAFIFSLFVTICVSAYGYRAPHELSFTKVLSTLNLSWNIYPDSYVQGSYWTLWPEIRFYGLFLIFVMLTKQFWSYNKRVTVFLVALFCLQYFTSTSPSGLRSITLSDYGVFFILGGLIGLCKSLEIFKAIWIFILGSTSLALIQLRIWILNWDAGNQNDLIMGSSIFIIAVAIIAISKKIILPDIKITRVINLLGKASYCFYLLQEGLGMPVTSLLVKMGLEIRYSISVSIIFVGLISILFTTKIEKPISKLLREKFLVGTKALFKQTSHPPQGL